MSRWFTVIKGLVHVCAHRGRIIGVVISDPTDFNWNIFCACKHGDIDVLKAGRRRVFIVFMCSFRLLLCLGCVRRCPQWPQCSRQSGHLCIWVLNVLARFCMCVFICILVPCHPWPSPLSGCLPSLHSASPTLRPPEKSKNFLPVN